MNLNFEQEGEKEDSVAKWVEDTKKENITNERVGGSSKLKATVQELRYTNWDILKWMVIHLFPYNKEFTKVTLKGKVSHVKKD